MKPRNYAKRGSRSNGSTPNVLSTHRTQKDSHMFSARIINVVKTSLEKQKKKIISEKLKSNFSKKECWSLNNKLHILVTQLGGLIVRISHFQTQQIFVVKLPGCIG